jgi:xylulokinase
MNTLAIDLGTTAAKVSVVTASGQIVGSGTEPVDTVFGSDRAAEQDPENVWQAVLRAARTALAQSGANEAREVRVVCATSQWSSIVPVDRAGLPVGPMLMWLDRRGENYISALSANDNDGGVATRAHWAEVHGLHPSTSLAHILYVQNDRPEIHDRTHAYLEPADYLSARFCGQIAATGCTAMPLALTDNRTLGNSKWSGDLIGRAGVDASKLPKIVSSLSVLGPLLPNVADDLGLHRATVVVTGANDSVAAAIGTNALLPGRGTVVMGTTGVLTAHHPVRVVEPSKFIATMPSALSDRFYVMAEAGLGGKVLETFLREFVYANDGFSEASSLNQASHVDMFERISSAIADVPVGSDGVMFLPWLIGSAAPKVDGHQRGAFLGISMRTSRAHMLRAVLEGISLQMRWLLDEVATTLRVPFPRVRFAGGGAQSAVWAQTMADVLGREVEQIEGPRHANARGAGLLGFLSVGELSVDDLASCVPIRQRFEPASHHSALFNERIEIYKDLHERLSEPTSRINNSRSNNSRSTKRQS